MATELVYFPVTGHFRDVEMPDVSGSTNTPAFNTISGTVIFWPRLPTGWSAQIASLDIGGGQVASTSLSIAPITAQILSGTLQAVDASDTPGVSLLSNTAAISSQLALIDQEWLTLHQIPQAGDLVYDVQLVDIVYSSAAQQITSYGFVAPTDTTPVDLCDPNLVRLPYKGPGA